MMKSSEEEDRRIWLYSERILRPVMNTMADWNLEPFIDEVIYLIFGEDFGDVRLQRGIKHWKPKELLRWMESLQFLGDEKAALLVALREKCLDGETFTYLQTHDRLDGILPLSTAVKLIFGLILTFWSFGITQSVPRVTSGMSFAILGGYVDDLTSLSREEAELLVQYNHLARTSGEGSVYGQLVVIGHSEYRCVEKKWVPFGRANRKFLLKRRKIGNGHTHSVSSAHETKHASILKPPEHVIDSLSQSIVIERSDAVHKEKLFFTFSPTPLLDCYQVGRATSSSNDFITPGQLHLGEDGVYTGPVGRWACRIACERLPPFRAYLFASGFSDRKQIVVEAVSALQDGFSSFGIRMRQPEVGEWLEVSITGQVYIPRRVGELPRLARPSTLGNQLTNGTLIDVGGVLLQYQDPIAMAAQKEISAVAVVQQWNAARPQCPVQFHDIIFDYVEQNRREQRAVRRIFEEDHYHYQEQLLLDDDSNTIMERDGENETDSTTVVETTRQSHEVSRTFDGPLKTKTSPVYNEVVHPQFTPVHIPSVDYSHISTEHRPYVYPACGHVHAYHKSLESMNCKACPVCRTQGAFVPLAFTFEPAICDAYPTHVFNPCGHVSSLETCEYWTNTPVHGKDIHLLSPEAELCSVCPFCATEINMKRPYSRLVFQSEKPFPIEEDESRSRPLDSYTSKASERSVDTLLQAQRCIFEKCKRPSSCSMPSRIVSLPVRTEVKDNGEVSLRVLSNL